MYKKQKINIRIFGSDNCPRCQFLMKSLELADMEYKYIDANSNENESLCDKYNVNKLPHIQLHSGNKVFQEFNGVVSPIFLINKIEEIKRNS